MRILGGAWLITTPYWFLATLAFDLLGFIHKRRPFWPEIVRHNYATAKRIACTGVILFVAALLAKGYHNYASPVTTTATIQFARHTTTTTAPTSFTATAATAAATTTSSSASATVSTTAAPTSSSAGSPKTLRVAVAADFHMGEIIGRGRVAQFVEKINALGADIILLPGDLVDAALAPVVAERCDEELRKLKAPLGVYAVLGNHDRDGGVTAFLTSAGIRVLRDEAVLVNGEFWLVGRVDRSGRGMVGEESRKAILEILPRTRSAGKPVIVLDHQPAKKSLAEAEAAGVDLLLSGHTHAGQTWPVTWLVRWIFKVSHGLGNSGATQVFVTSGLGLWGFPARIGSRAEVVELRIIF
ncbi:MAG: metallophosphoesterase [Puniceicoccales bacterium]|nr:metallophosphoesterase [Puniceicoccales bacterium]